MRWWLRAALAVVLVVVAAEVGARVLVERSGTAALRSHDHSTALKVEQLERGIDPDVVVIGTSMAQQALVPEVMAGIDGVGAVYNAGLNGGVPVVMDVWLGDHVLPSVDPDTVVWGIGPLDVSDVYGAEVLTAYHDALDTRPGALASVDRMLSAGSTLVRDRTVLRSFDRLFGVDADRRAADRAEAERQLGSDGERVEFRQATDEVRALEVRSRITPMVLDRDDLAAIVRATTALRDDGVRVVFVRLPVPERLTELFADPSDPVRVDAAIERLADELGVDLLDTSETFTNDDFVDFTHLDAAGAARFSADIGRQLAALDD